MDTVCTAVAGREAGAAGRRVAAAAAGSAPAASGPVSAPELRRPGEGAGVTSGAALLRPPSTGDGWRAEGVRGGRRAGVAGARGGGAGDAAHGSAPRGPPRR